MFKNMTAKEARIAVMRAGGDNGICVTLGNRIHGEWPDGSRIKVYERHDGGCGYTVETENLEQSVASIIRNNAFVAVNAFSESFQKNHQAFTEALQALL